MTSGETETFTVVYDYYLGDLGSGNYGDGNGVDDGIFVSATNAGKYQVRATIAGSANWDEWTQSVTLHIKKLTWTHDDDPLEPIYLNGGKIIVRDYNKATDETITQQVMNPDGTPAEDAEGNLSLMTPEKDMPSGAEIC